LYDLILPTIGRTLISLEYASSIPIQEILQMFDFGFEERSIEKKDVAVDLLKGGLMKLSKLKVNRRFVRLGTDWEG
jgi:hypothetical protein